MKERVATLLKRTFDACVKKGLLSEVAIPFVELERPRESAHGDYASNIALVLASRLRMPPRRIADLLVEKLEDPHGILEKTEIAGPGFMNFFIKDQVWRSLLREVDAQGRQYGENDLGRGRRVQVEFVSANPTGPLHIGHARGAVVGDVIARILESSRFSVHREYYINDAGNQMYNLGRSVLFRIKELQGEEVVFPEECYQGGYVREIARDMMKTFDEASFSDDEKAISLCTRYASDAIMAGIRDDLQALDVTFDSYFSERELYNNDGLFHLLAALEQKGHVYHDKGARWFQATAFGDEKDRVVVRGSGEPTYFAADIAYHESKFNRGFDRVIDVWGSDHHGYVPRLQAAIQALGHDRGALQIVLVQLVNLLRDGKPVAMSTRSGEFVTMRDVINEVGKDAARYHFLMRRSDSHLDFDLEVAKRQSNDNPVYYVQYAHARICSIFGTAREQGYEIPAFRDVDVEVLTLHEELALIRAITAYPEALEGAARTLEPHRLAFFLIELAGIFHNYYNKHRIVSADQGVTKARLVLVHSVQTVLQNGLNVLGVSAPGRM